MLNASEIMELQKLSGMEKFSKLTVKQALDREKLIELLGDKLIFGRGILYEVADHLIANNVVLVVRCKDCDWYRKHEGGICVNPKCVKSWYGCPVPAEHFCSCGERRDNG